MFRNACIRPSIISSLTARMPSVPKDSHVKLANALPTTIASFKVSKSVEPQRATWPMNPPANVSPAPVGSTTSSGEAPGRRT